MIWALLGEFWEYIVGGVAVLVALFAARRSGANRVRLDHATDRQRRVEAGRDAVRDNRDRDPSQRLRDNDGRW